MEETIRPDRKLFTKTIWVFLTVSVFIVLGVALIHLIIHVAGEDPRVPPVLWLISGTVILAMWIIGYPIARLWINDLSYVVQEDRLTIQKGILTKTLQNIPYQAITDLLLRRSLYDRILGLGAIKIQTAGPSQGAAPYEGNMIGLVAYDRIHSELRERIRAPHTLSESPTGKELSGGSAEQILGQILEELKAIRENTAK